MAKKLTPVRLLLWALAFTLQVLVLASPAWAWPPTYGAEFEVGRPGLGDDYDFTKQSPSLSPEKQEQMRLVNHVRSRCLSLGCQVIEVPGKFDKDYKVQYPDGWFFKISYDPGCVEITFKPSSADVIDQKAALINDHIFQSAREVGLTVTDGNNAHFNMGIRSAFNDSAKEFLRFFVDYSNHADLALGSLGHDIYNAPPLSILGKDQREALQRVIADFESGKLKTLADVARAIQAQVYTRSFEASWGGIHHYQAVGLKYVNRTDLTRQDAPFELRAVWVQHSAEQFNLISRLMEARMSYLRSLNTPIIYSATDRAVFSTSELKTRFDMYVAEAGLDPVDFESLLPEQVRNAGQDPFASRKAKPKKRLARVNAYWDLVETSELAQAKIVEILSLPELQQDPEVADWKKTMRGLSGKNPVYQMMLEAIAGRNSGVAADRYSEIGGKFGALMCSKIFH